MIFRLPFFLILVLSTSACATKTAPVRTFHYPVYVFDSKECAFKYRGNEKVIPCSQADSLFAMSPEAFEKLIERYLYSPD
jgi:hypothetical protein